MTTTYVTGKTTVTNGGYTFPSGNVTINSGTTGATGSTGTFTIGGGGGGAGTGYVYTTTTTGTGATWVNPNTAFTNSNGKPVMTIPHGENKVVLEDKATLEVKGKVKINGIDLEERLKTIEKVLMIPERDVILEKKYPKLKKMYDEYIAALGKYRTFEAIKGEDND